MYKLHVRLHLDYGDIIYHKYDSHMVLDFTKKLEATQYAAALAVSGPWRGTNRDKLYEELGWEYLYHPRWYRRLIHFYNRKKSHSPLYLYNLIPPEREVHYNLRIPRDFEPEQNGFQTRIFKIVSTSGIRLMCQFVNAKLFPNSKLNSLS